MEVIQISTITFFQVSRLSSTGYCPVLLSAFICYYLWSSDVYYLVFTITLTTGFTGFKVRYKKHDKLIDKDFMP